MIILKTKGYKNWQDAVYHGYLRLVFWVIGFAMLGILLGMSVKGDTSIAVALAISVAFSVISCFTYARLWRKVALKSPAVLTKFYLASPVVRMLAGALVIIVYCLLVRSRSDIIQFAVVFGIFYLLILIVDSVFFSRLERTNRN